MKKLVMIMLALTLTISVANAYDAPSGGWAYTYDGASASSAVTTALDGTWDHKDAGSGSSDAWDGSAPGQIGPVQGGDSPGGAVVNVEGSDTYLRIQDAGHPENWGEDLNPDASWSDPSNRKLTFAHDMGQDAGVLNGGTILDDGVTLNFRIRIPSTGTLDNYYPNDKSAVATIPWPAGGIGYTIHSDGMGPIGIKQGAGGDGMISFGLTHGESRDGEQDTTSTAGLVMNQTALTAGIKGGDVQTGDGNGTENILAIANVNDWHDFWVTIEGEDINTPGTHTVKIWMDGNDDPGNPDGTFLVTAGQKSEYGYNGYLNMAHGSSGWAGSTDIDSYSYKPGVHDVPEPMTLTLLGLGGLGLIRRRRK